MGWFDDAVRRWRTEAARRAVVATASAAAAATRSAVERVVERVAGEEDEGEGDGETPADDRLGRAARIRADAQAREERRAAAKDVVDRVGDLVRRGTGGGGGSTG